MTITRKTEQVFILIIIAASGSLIAAIFLLPISDFYQLTKQKLFTPVPPPPIEKTFIPLTPKEIAVSLEGIKNKLDFDDIARVKYYRKYVKWTGTIKDISLESKDVVGITLVFKPVKDNDFTVPVHTRFYKQVVRHLYEGNEITAVGMISNISPLSDRWIFISLEYCELVNIPQ